MRPAMTLGGSMAETGLERYLSNILETVAEGIALIGADGVFTFANSAAEGILGTPKDVIVGRRYDDRVWELTGPDGRPVPVDQLPSTKVMLTGEPVFDTVLGAELSDGRRVKITVNAVPFRDREGRLVGTLVSFRDVTHRERVERLDRALSEISIAVNSSFDYDTILQRALDRAVDALGCESGILFLKDGPDWVIRYLCNLPSDLRGTRIPEEQASFTEVMGATGGAIALNDAYKDERLGNRIMRRYTIKSMLDVTIRVRGRDLGHVSFINHSEAVPFTQDDVDFANKFGAMVGLALENSDLYRAEQETALYLQRALVGSPAPVPGVAFSHAYLSGTKSAIVGGDFYDLFAADSGHVAVLLGDVSGKGLPKATVAAMAKHTMIAYLLEQETPARVAMRADRIIAHSTGYSTFITAVIGLLDPSTGRFQYCNAGHPRPLVLRADGHVERLEVGSPLLGVLDDPTFDQAETSLAPGDTLLLFTDGVTEARNKSGMLGDEGIADLLERSADVPIGDLAGRLLEQVSDFVGGRPGDDVAILAVQLEERGE